MTITIFLNNLNEIVTALTDIFINVMSVFMEPPLNIFVAILIFMLLMNKIAKYLMHLDKKGFEKEWIEKGFK